MNQKDSKNKEDKNKSDCGELGRSSNSGSEDHHDKIIRQLREQFKENFPAHHKYSEDSESYGDVDHEDYIDELPVKRSTNHQSDDSNEY